MGHKDKETRNAYHRAYYQANKDKIIARNYERGKNHRLSRREWMNSLKDKPCMDCGNKYIPEAMDFDHVRGKKLFGVGGRDASNHSKEEILKEIDKCDLVCATCHRIRTYNRRNNRQ